jgi:hypothetical protein
VGGGPGWGGSRTAIAVNLPQAPTERSGQHGYPYIPHKETKKETKEKKKRKKKKTNKCVLSLHSDTQTKKTKSEREEEKGAADREETEQREQQIVVKSGRGRGRVGWWPRRRFHRHCREIPNTNEKRGTNKPE